MKVRFSTRKVTRYKLRDGARRTRKLNPRNGEAEGSLRRSNDGKSWDASICLTEGVPSLSAEIKIKVSRARRKRDAVDIGNDVAEKLGWSVRRWVDYDYRVIPSDGGRSMSSSFGGVEMQKEVQPRTLSVSLKELKAGLDVDKKFALFESGQLLRQNLSMKDVWDGHDTKKFHRDLGRYLIHIGIVDLFIQLVKRQDLAELSSGTRDRIGKILRIFHVRTGKSGRKKK